MRRGLRTFETRLSPTSLTTTASSRRQLDAKELYEPYARDGLMALLEQTHRLDTELQQVERAWLERVKS